MKSSKCKFEIDLSTLYQYRSIWLGIAMIWVIFYHSSIIIHHPVIEFVKSIGYAGVDIFLFASGLGLYYSYTKDHDPIQFLKRRLNRLAPAYLLFMGIWIAFQLFNGDNMPIQAIVGNFFAVQEFTGLGYYFNWYISILFIVYILTPFFSGIIERVKTKYQFFLFISLLLLISIAFWGSHDGIIIMARLPIFAIGMYFAKLGKEDKKKLDLKLASILIISMIAGIILLIVFFTNYKILLWIYGWYWYPFILIIPGLCLIISLISELIKKYKIGKGVLYILKKIGEYSFEIYLVHIFVFGLYDNYLKVNEITLNSNSEPILIILLLIPLCLTLRICSKWCRKLMIFMMKFFKKYFGVSDVGKV